MHSDDEGVSWAHSNFIGNGNECQIAPAAGGSSSGNGSTTGNTTLIMNMRGKNGIRQFSYR